MPGDDRGLISGFLRGEHGAVSQIEQWIAAASAPFRTRLGGDLDDVRQETLMELTKAFLGSRFRFDSALVSYVWRVANHACLKRIRANSRWAPDVTDLLQRVKDDRKTAAEAMADRDRMEGLRRLVLRMPAECQELWRRILSGQSYQSMASELAIAEGTLRVRVLRCRQKANALRVEENERNTRNKGPEDGPN